MVNLGIEMQRLMGIFSGLKNSCCTCMPTDQLTRNYNLIGFQITLQKIGVEVTWVKENSIEQYKQAVKSNTKVRSYTIHRHITG